MKRPFLYLTALTASLLLAQGCTQENVPATKPLLTENDQVRLRELESLGFKKSPTEAEFLSFKSSFTSLTAPELDYFNQLVTHRSIGQVKATLPAAEQEPAIRTLELSLQQRKQMNAYAVQTFGKTYLHLSEGQFMQAAGRVGLAWQADEEKALPAARATVNPGCTDSWNCSVALIYSNSGSAAGHPPFNTSSSVYDNFNANTVCNYGFLVDCSELFNHNYLTSIDAYTRTMFTTPRPSGFGGTGIASERITSTTTRRFVLSKNRVDYWGFTPSSLAPSLRVWVL